MVAGGGGTVRRRRRPVIYQRCSSLGDRPPDSGHGPAQTSAAVTPTAELPRKQAAGTRPWSAPAPAGWCNCRPSVARRLLEKSSKRLSCYFGWGEMSSLEFWTGSLPARSGCVTWRALSVFTLNLASEDEHGLHISRQATKVFSILSGLHFFLPHHHLSNTAVGCRGIAFHWSQKGCLRPFIILFRTWRVHSPWFSGRHCYRLAQSLPYEHRSSQVSLKR